jgi:hypothetical protein
MQLPSREQLRKKVSSEQIFYKCMLIECDPSMLQGRMCFYPGDDVPPIYINSQEYRELLPGLGAFVLRPMEGSVSRGGCQSNTPCLPRSGFRSCRQLD